MKYSAAMHRAIEDGDVETARRIMAEVTPHLPQPESDEQAAATLHHARTGIASISFKKRAYSHAWLRDRGLPSALPDHLKPRAERLYPVIVEAVGIAVKTPPHRHGLGIAVHDAMSDAVKECYADRKTDPVFVRARMMEAREKIRRI